MSERNQDMTSLHYLLVQFRSSCPMIGLILVVSAILIGAVVFLRLVKGIPTGDLTNDPSEIGGLPAYAGFLSQIGIFFWSASATVCFFCVTVLPRHTDRHHLKRFLLISGLLTLFLGLDDTFLLHESVFPYFGIPEKFVFGSYGAFVLLYLFRFYPLILETEFVLMAIALFFFGVSIILDLLLPIGIFRSYLFEDGPKLIGIVSWLAYFLRVGKYSVTLDTAQKKFKK